MYNAPKIEEIGSLADLTGAGDIHKIGNGTDVFSALSGLTGSLATVQPK